MSRIPDTTELLLNTADRELPGWVNMVTGAGVLWGILGLGYAAAMGEAAWAVGSLLVAIYFTFALSQGGVLFGVMMQLSRGHWGTPAKRVAESFGAFLPFIWISIVLFVVLGNGMYPWHEGQWLLDEAIPLEPHSPAAYSAKPMWLSLPFWMARVILSTGLLIFLSFNFLKNSWRPDMIKTIEVMKANGKEFTPPGWWGYFTKGAGDSASEADKAYDNRNLFGALTALAYPVVFSFMVFDLIMSLAPWWFANMFGVWNFVSSFWISLCGFGIVLVLSKKWLKLEPFVGANVTHDLGKLILAACMFWAYTTYAHLLPIWYANMPEETDFLLIRLKLPQWAWLSWTVGILCFLMPFTTLLSRGIKKMPVPFAALLGTIMFGLFLERTLQVMPSVYFGDTFPVPLLVLTSMGCLAMYLGLFVAVVARVLQRLPSLAVMDPHVEPHPWDVHVHSLDQAHH